MRSESSSSVRVFYPRYDRKTVIETLKQKVEVLKKELSMSRLVLFGSYARGDYTVGSDIDLLIVCKRPIKDAYAKAKRAVGIQGIEPHIYSEHEYRAMGETVKRMLEGGVTIYIEKGFGP